MHYSYSKVQDRVILKVIYIRIQAKMALRTTFGNFCFDVDANNFCTLLIDRNSLCFNVLN
jgi:hypothetical protein